MQHPQLQTLLHVFRQFIGKFHFWNVSLYPRNSKDCDEAIGLAQEMSRFAVNMPIVWLQVCLSWQVNSAKNDHVVKIERKLIHIRETSPFKHVNTLQNKQNFEINCNNCGCSCVICGWSDCDNCGCNCNNCGCDHISSSLCLCNEKAAGVWLGVRWVTVP